jgi:methyl-accepting chemotaxis protein
MKFRTKVILLPVIASLELFIILAVFYISNAEISKMMGDIEEGYIPALEISRNLEDGPMRIQRILQNIVTSDDVIMLFEVDSVKQQFINLLDEAEKYKSISGEKVAEIREAFNEYYNLAYDIYEKVEDGSDKNLNGNMELISKKHIALSVLLNSQTEYYKNQIAQEMQRVRELQASNNVIIIVSIILSVALLAIFSFFIIRSATVPLKKLSEIAERIGAGDLTVDIEASGKRKFDEFSRLALQINKMKKSLNDLIGQIIIAADDIAKASEGIITLKDKINHGALSQATATEQVSASMQETSISIRSVANNSDSLATNVEETSASINELIASIGSVADNVAILSESVDETSTMNSQMMAAINQIESSVKRATLFTESTSNEAGSGGKSILSAINSLKSITDSMEETGQVIENLNKKSESIGEIISVIDGIADQTNLLALNAAIEAARAGESGKGFAVVASEIRKLAERSGKATSEIGQIIGELQQDTHSAVKKVRATTISATESIDLADSAVVAIQKIVESVGETNKLMNHIKAAVEETVNTSQKVLEASERISTITDFFSEATHEQSQGSDLIKVAIMEMNNMTWEVSSATKEQSQGAEQMLVSVRQISEIANDNLNLAEEISDSGQNLSSLANLLLQSTSYFNIEQDSKVTEKQDSEDTPVSTVETFEA